MAKKKHFKIIWCLPLFAESNPKAATNHYAASFKVKHSCLGYDSSTSHYIQRGGGGVGELSNRCMQHDLCLFWIYKRSPLYSNLVRLHKTLLIHTYLSKHVCRGHQTSLLARLVCLLIPNMSLSVRGGEYLHFWNIYHPLIWQFGPLSKGSLIWSNELRFQSLWTELTWDTRFSPHIILNCSRILLKIKQLWFINGLWENKYLALINFRINTFFFCSHQCKKGKKKNHSVPINYIPINSPSHIMLWQLFNSEKHSKVIFIPQHEKLTPIKVL